MSMKPLEFREVSDLFEEPDVVWWPANRSKMWNDRIRKRRENREIFSHSLKQEMNSKAKEERSLRFMSTRKSNHSSIEVAPTLKVTTEFMLVRGKNSEHTRNRQTDWDDTRRQKKPT